MESVSTAVKVRSGVISVCVILDTNYLETVMTVSVRWML